MNNEPTDNNKLPESSTTLLQSTSAVGKNGGGQHMDPDGQELPSHLLYRYIWFYLFYFTNIN